MSLITPLWNKPKHCPLRKLIAVVSAMKPVCLQKITASNNKGKGAKQHPPTLKSEDSCVFARFTNQLLKLQIPMPLPKINPFPVTAGPPIGPTIIKASRVKPAHTNILLRVMVIRFKKNHPHQQATNQALIVQLTDDAIPWRYPAPNGIRG